MFEVFILINYYRDLFHNAIQFSVLPIANNVINITHPPVVILLIQ